MASAFHLLLSICLTSCLTACGGAGKQTQGDTTLPEVTIPQGTVRGFNMVTRHNRRVHGFLGVPYAQPPVGDLRFKAPVRPTAWKGILDCKHYTTCVQMGGGSHGRGEVIGNEDCLQLNIYTPQLPKRESSTLLPVMLYVGGGAFQAVDNNAAGFGPDNLLDKDVVLVLVNFRVGVLGWLSTGDEVSPGNYGLKDIVRALEWNRDNIKYFGGDPNRVTLFGSSTGAMSVSLLAMSDSTEGLFHRFIEQSGSAFMPMFQEPSRVAVERAFRLGAYLNCSTNTSTLLVSCLRGLHASQLVNTTLLFTESKFVPYMPWFPTAEPDVEGAFLTQTPMEIYTSGKIRDLPTIRSNTEDEGIVITGALYVDPYKMEDVLDDIDHLLPLVLTYKNSIYNVKNHIAALKLYYLNDLTANRSLLLNNLTQLIGDVLFSYPLYKELQQYATLAASPQYYCSFGYRGVRSYSYHYTGGSTRNIGVAHGEELLYLFPDGENLFGPAWSRFSEADLKMVDTMVELWTSFATNGTPNAVGANGKTIWEPYSSSRNYLRIGNGKEARIDVKYGWHQQRMEFLDQLAPTIRWK